MGYEQAVNFYRKTSVETSDRLGLVIICYEEAIRCLRQAKVEYDRTDYAAKTQHLNKAQNLIWELLACLDTEKGEELATNLSNLYRFMLKRLIQGDVRREPQAFHEVAGLLEELLEAWKAIAGNNKLKAQFPQACTKPTVAARGFAV